MKCRGGAKVSTEAAKSRIRFAVQDDGLGIPEDLSEFVLMPFIRLDQGGKQDRGVGLAESGGLVV